MASDTKGKMSWNPTNQPQPSTSDIQLLNQRVIQFTDIEDTFLDVWLALENADLDELAAKVLNAGLLFEHYLSQLPNDPAQRAPEEAAQLETYRMSAGTALDEGRAALASMNMGSGSSSMIAVIIPTAVKTATLTLWSYLAFQEYLAVNSGDVLSMIGFGMAAVVELFCGFWISGYNGIARKFNLSKQRRMVQTVSP